MGFKFLDYGLQIKRHYVQDCLVSETQDDVMDRHGTARLNSSNLVKADSIILDPEGYGRWSSKEMKKIRVQGVRFEVHPDDIKLMVHRFTRTRSPAPDIRKVYLRHTCIVMTSDIHAQLGAWLSSIQHPIGQKP
ncbi:hypothetical protein HN588_10590 [Candidatus Bathyarchaeota archaeon]|nr:hypothetical protein [Candidatus Bathyarchaeota archaeon]